MDPSKQTSLRIFIFIFTLLCWNSADYNHVQAASYTPASCSISNPLGMQSGAIPDNDITQSSIYQGSSQYAGNKARLNKVGAWYASQSDTNAWIQVKFPHRYTITAIATQGHQGFVKEFILKSSDDGINWKTYTVNNVTKSFQGNKDGNNIVNNTIDPPLAGKFIRLQVKQCDTYCSLRMELYGCNNTDPAILPSACPSISQPKGSNLSCTASEALGSICKFSCKPLYVLVGKPVLLCQNNGTWNATTPVCYRLPDQPSSLQTSSTFSRSIKVSWIKPMDGSSSIIDYSVYWIAKNQKIYKEKIVTKTTATLDVDPYTDYTIKVRARNAYGYSLWSPSITARSDEAVPSMTPSNFIVKSESPLSLTVQWGKIPPEGRHGVIVGYYVYYFKNGSISGDKHQVVVNGSTFTFTLSNLEYDAYYVSVAGYTRMGHGPKTSLVKAVPMGGAPTAPLNLKAEVKSPTSILLSWSPPQKPNGKISKYTLKYGLKQDLLMYSVQIKGSVLQFLVKSLEEFTTYYFLVYGQTQMTGKPSNFVSAKTLEDAPSATPKIDATIARDAYTIYVSWDEVTPKDRNGVIMGYTVFYRMKGHPKFQNKTINDATKLSTEITGLFPYTEVCVKLAAFTKVGLSKNWDQETCTNITTLPTGPSAPVDVTLKAESSTSILVQWKAPTTPNGVIEKYLIYHGYQKDNLKNEDDVTGKTYSKMITGLRKYTPYYVQVRGKTNKPGNASSVKTIRTLEDAPSAPIGFRSNGMSPNSIVVQWKKPTEINGILRSYYLKVYERKTGMQVGTFNRSARPTSLNEYLFYMVPNLKPFRIYDLTIQAVTVRPGEMANTTAKTEEGVPSSPTNIQLTLTELSIDITWDPPAEENGVMTMYKIYCLGSRSYDLNFSDQKLRKVLANETNVTINDLKPGTKYDIYVAAKTKKGEGKKTDPMTVNTNAEAPPAPKDPPDTIIDSVSHDSITIILKPSPQTNGEIIAHQVIVETLGKLSKRSIDPLPKTIYDHKNARKHGSRFYVAAEFRGADVPPTFKLGDGKNYNGYYNAPLEAQTKYRVYVRGATKDEYGKWIYGSPAASSLPATADDPTLQKSSDQTIGIIAGIIGALILIAIIVIAILLYKRSKRPLKANVDVENQKSKSKRRFRDLEVKRLGKKRPMSLPGEVTNDPEHPPIPVENFAKHVHKLHKSDDRGFMIEYNKLDIGRDFPCENAYLADNKNKNRYGNIVAYDHSRVVLSVIDNKPHTDYINASHIDGYNKPSAYIATQGPVPHTFEDFWRMVWEQQSSTIVMLTNLQERHKLKCHKYWPDEIEDYGDISVKQLKCEHYADYSIRTFNVKRESEKEEREVRQFHFTVWPDHGVPEYPTAILAFRRRQRAYNPPDSGPVIVHCSAGVGRSGTYIVIDAMLDKIKAENTVDIFNYVAYLRSRRTAMVQTEEQYTFCHDAILEAIQCGNTQILAHDLRIALSKMEVVDKDTKMSQFEKEFKTLNKVSPVLPKACYIVATYPENKEKNRYQDVLASDFSRVMLTAIDDNEITTYINAVHISGYKQQHAFIITQYPLTATITDLWRMLCEQESACLVVFQPTEEGDFPQFWPEEGKQIYDEMITVECQIDKSNSIDNLRSTYDQSEITDYKFKITDLRIPEKELIVKMFVLSGWANEDEPPDTSSMITLVAKVEKWQQQSGNGAITVMCSDGIGRSGTFCSLYSVLERVKIEQVVDVLQAIKAMRIPRPGLVKTTAEYRLIHYTVQEYLAAFDDYANFK